MVAEPTASSEPTAPTRSTIGSGPVVVGIDGSANAARAVGVAADLAVHLDVELVMVHAVGLMSVIDGRHVVSEGHRDELQRCLDDDWCAPLRATPGLRWRALLVDGSPIDVVTAVADDNDASLVVVGSRGVGQGQLLGSTSHHLVHHCTRPVVVVPPVGD